MFTLASALVNHAAQLHHAALPTPRAVDYREFVPVPPQEIEIENPNAQTCSAIPKQCTVGDDSTCLACKEFGWTCQFLADSIEIRDTGIVVPASRDATQGWCLPPSNLANEINALTTGIFLTFSSSQQVWNYKTLCKYPTIFSSLSDRENCSVYHNPCYGGVLGDERGIAIDPEHVTVDPFVNGRCLVASDSGRVPVWDLAQGPRTVVATLSNGGSANFRCTTGYTRSDELYPTFGIRSDISNALSALPAPICIPDPCKTDSVSGAFSGANWYDYEYKCCVCDTLKGWVAAREDFSGDGNYVDSPSGFNACHYTGKPMTLFEEHAYVYADGTSLMSIEVGDGEKYQVHLRYGEARPPRRDLNRCLEGVKLLVVPSEVNSSTNGAAVREDVQQTLIDNWHCLDADNNVIYNPVLANGRIVQANQRGPQLDVLGQPFTTRPKFGSIRSNYYSYRPGDGDSVLPPGKKQISGEICLCCPNGCGTDFDILRDWRLSIQPAAVIPDQKNWFRPGPTFDNLTTNRLIAKGVDVRV